MVRPFFEDKHGHASRVSSCSDTRLDELSGESYGAHYPCSSKLRSSPDYLHMNLCYGMYAVRAKAQEFSHVRDAPRDLDKLGPNQLQDDGRVKKHTIALDVPPPLPTTVTSGDSPRQLVFTPVASHGFVRERQHTHCRP